MKRLQPKRSKDSYIHNAVHHYNLGTIINNRATPITKGWLFYLLSKNCREDYLIPNLVLISLGIEFLCTRIETVFAPTKFSDICI